MKISRKLARWALCVCAWSIGSMGTAQSAVDMFLKLDDVQGETADRPHRGEIEVLSWSWGANNSPTLPGGSTGRFTAHDFTFTKLVDKASPVLAKGCAAGKHFAQAIITLRQRGNTQVEFVHIMLEDVLVTRILVNAPEGGEQMSEEVSLKFARVGVEYFTITATGTAGERGEFAWDLVKNRAGGVNFPTLTDGDADGLPDEWEQQYGLDPSVNDGRLDKDGDGATNFEEFVAGTSPASANQVFRSILAFPSGSQTARLSWTSAPGKTYNILIGLLLGESFQLFRTMPSSGDGTTSVDVPAGAENRFYRVEVVPETAQ